MLVVTMCHFVSRESKGYLELSEVRKRVVIPLMSSVVMRAFVLHEEDIMSSV